MTAAEVLKMANAAGLTLALDGSKLRVRGGSREKRAELAPILAPLARDIAGLLAARDSSGPAIPAACTIGLDSPDPCPSCRYVHGVLERDPCSRCGRTTWPMAVVDGTALVCAWCVRAAAPPGGRHNASSGGVA